MRALILLLLVVAGCAKKPEVSSGPCASRAACEAQCDARNGQACADAARLLLEDPQRDLKSVMARYAQGCALNNGSACMGAAGDAAALPEARRSFLEKAAGLLPVECEKGSALACEQLMAIKPGEAGTKAGERARTLLNADCTKGNAAACHRLGSALLHGRLGAALPTDGEALLEKACTAGIAGACAELGMAYNFGKELTQDPLKAKQYMQRAGSLSAARDAGL